MGPKGGSPQKSIFWSQNAIFRISRFGALYGVGGVESLSLRVGEDFAKYHCCQKGYQPKKTFGKLFSC